MNTKELGSKIWDTKGSFTTIAGSLGILTVYILWSKEILNEPNILIYVAIFIIFSAIGGGLDQLQEQLKE
jgi:hypothetical protein